jgi:hypothetical protein
MDSANPPPAGQPSEARVEQRHYDLVTKIFAPYCEIITEVLDNEAAQLIAASEARAVAEQTHTLSLHLTEASRMVAELQARLELLESQHETRLAAFEEYKKLREAQLAKAEAALREAQKDSARLDWLESVAPCTAIGRAPSGQCSVFTPDNYESAGHKSFRAAIDAAALLKEGAKP